MWLFAGFSNGFWVLLSEPWQQSVCVYVFVCKIFESSEQILMNILVRWDMVQGAIDYILLTIQIMVWMQKFKNFKAFFIYYSDIYGHRRLRLMTHSQESCTRNVRKVLVQETFGTVSFRTETRNLFPRWHHNNNNLTTLHKTTFTLPLTSPLEVLIFVYLCKWTYKFVTLYLYHFYVCTKWF